MGGPTQPTTGFPEPRDAGQADLAHASQISRTRFGAVDLAQSGAVAVAVFSRPPDNYFDAELLDNIATALEEADSRTNIRAVVLASEGRSFCAGAALGQSSFDPAPVYAQGSRIFAIRKPIVAAVQGAAIGGGLGLALAADFRVVSEETRFSANFVKVGIHPGFGLTLTLPRLVGSQTASLLLLTGRRINGRTAVEIGAADLIVPAADLRTRAIEFAAELAAGAPLAVQATRSTLRADLLEKLPAHLEVEIDHQRTLFLSNDFQEGIAAVRERRPGEWTGQ
jgi:enoyl-CoA hydratase/carnithine racemase